MKTLQFAFIGSLLLLLSACNAQVEWQQNLTLWNTQAKSYQYTLRSIPATVDTEVTVTDGKVTSARTTSETPFGVINIPILGQALTLIPSIDQHFLALAPQLSDENLEVTYNETYGYPTRYSNFVPNTEDRVGFEILNVVFK